jgi:hypothetical protein
MTRDVVFLTTALAAASLGLFAENKSPNPPTPPPISSPAARQSTAGGLGPQPASRSVPEATASNPASSGAQSRSSSTPAGTDGGFESSGPASKNVNENTNAQRPQSSTILPLLGLIGLGSLVAGLFARR